MDRGKEKIASTQAYLPIKEIKEGVVLMNDNSLRAVVIVSSLNFALKSEQEKDAIISSFQGFLNSLNFPIQIVDTSKKLDLSQYLGRLKKMVEEQTNPLLKIQTQEYINFIEKLLEESNIMEKRYYVVVPYFPAGVEIKGGVGDVLKKGQANITGDFAEHKRRLLSRVQLIIEGLNSVGLRCSVLDTKNLLELYYTSYNPDTAENQRLLDVDSFSQEIISGGGRKQDGNF